jgi:hypothetical protein
MWAVGLVVALVLLLTWYLYTRPISQERVAVGPLIDTPSGTVLTYMITGGIAGYNTRLYVDANGGYTLTSRGTMVRQGVLDPNALAQVQLLQQNVHGPIACSNRGNGNDLMSYSVQVNGYTVDVGSDLCVGTPGWLSTTRALLDPYVQNLPSPI